MTTTPSRTIPVPAAVQPAAQVARRRAWLLLTGVTLAGAGLRFYRLDAKTLWLDEAFSIWIARHPPAEIIDWLVRIDQHPPLYYLLLAGWIRLFGDQAGAVRSLSALCSTFTIPLIYLTARQLRLDRTAALLAALILALAPFHVRFAQETRMYALLTLLAAGAMLGAVGFLQRFAGTPPRDGAWRSQPLLWAGLLVVCQAGVMWTHNTATVFFPLALNLPILGAWLYQRWSRHAVALPAVNERGFLRAWLAIQGLAVLLWLPWLAPFLRQAAGVDREFWIPPPDLPRIQETLQTFAFAHLPPSPVAGALLLVYLGLATLGCLAFRTRAAWLLLSLWLTPFVGELLVSLRRPIFYDRTLLWTTLAFYLLMAAGVRSLDRQSRGRTLQAALVALIIVVSSVGLQSYFRTFEKEGWADAAAYVADSMAPGDLLLFNATWVQLPFEYYFRAYDRAAELRGVPSDLFSSGQLEPKMTGTDVAYLQELVAARPRVWLIYSHDWYTDPEQLIKRTLDAELTQANRREFRGLQVLEYVRQ